MFFVVFSTGLQCLRGQVCCCQIFYGFVFPLGSIVVSFALLSYSICGFCYRYSCLHMIYKTKKSIILCASQRFCLTCSGKLLSSNQYVTVLRSSKVQCQHCKIPNEDTEVILFLCACYRFYCPFCIRLMKFSRLFLKFVKVSVLSLIIVFVVFTS